MMARLDAWRRLPSGHAFSLKIGTPRIVDHHVADRVQHFLRRRRKGRGRAVRILADQDIFGPLGVKRFNVRVQAGCATNL
jgi:hypothetical protein